MITNFTNKEGRTGIIDTELGMIKIDGQKPVEFKNMSELANYVEKETKVEDFYHA